MRRGMPELAAIPLVIVLLGLVFAIMLVLDAGAVAMIVVGAIAAVAIVVAAVILMRRPRSSSAGGPLAPFEGGAPRPGDGVHRVLLVADDDCTAIELQDLAAPAGADRTAMFVVAPAVSSRVDRWTGDEHAYAGAQERLDRVVQTLSGLGVEATGRLGPHDPLQAADDALREFPADEIVFALQTRGKTEWLEQGVVELGQARYSVPVRELKTDALNDGAPEATTPE